MSMLYYSKRTLNKSFAYVRVYLFKKDSSTNKLYHSTNYVIHFVVVNVFIEIENKIVSFTLKKNCCYYSNIILMYIKHL